MLRNLLFHLKRTVCILRGKHLAGVYVGEFGKKGYRTVPLYQCQYCSEIWFNDADWKRIGGKVKS